MWRDDSGDKDGGPNDGAGGGDARNLLANSFIANLVGASSSSPSPVRASSSSADAGSPEAQPAPDQLAEERRKEKLAELHGRGCELNATVFGMGRDAVDRGVVYLADAKSDAEKRLAGLKEPDLSKTPPEKQAIAKESYEKRKAELLRKAGRDPAELTRNAINVIFQSLGDAFEIAAIPLIKRNHGGCSIYHGLRSGDAELDFLVIDGDNVVIYSAKIDRDAYHPTTDKAHWTTIRKGWAELEAARRATSIQGADIAQPPTTAPTVYCVAAETFGLTPSAFLDLLVPDWRKRLGQ